MGAGLGVISVLILGPFVFIGLGAVIVLVGALWSPAAAVLCARAARRKGLDPKRYAMLGGLYSTLMIVPWVLLLLRLCGNRIPWRLLALSYWVLYGGIWGCGVIALFANIILLVILVLLFEGADSASLLWPIMIALMLCANVLALTVSARGLIKRWRADQVAGVGLMAQDSHRFSKSYVMPFVHAIAATALSISAHVVLGSE